MDRITRLFSLVLLVVGCGFPALAQNEFRSAPIPEAGIEITAPNRLERLPNKLGAESAYHLAKFRPRELTDKVQGFYWWSCDVYSWSKKTKEGDEPDLPEGMDEATKEKIKRLIAESGSTIPKSFKEWFDDQGNVTEVQIKGKKQRGKRGKLDYEHWAWVIDNQFGPHGLSYCEAAVYDFEDRQVAVVILMPLEKIKPPKPKRRWKKLIDTVMKSGKAFKGGDNADKSKDKHADEPWKKEELQKAKKNIAGLKGWDYFTTPNYIVIYSWDFQKPAEQGKSKTWAKKLSSDLEKMRALFMDYFPLDETGTKAPMPDPKSVPDTKGPVTGGGETSGGLKIELPDGAQGEETERLGTRRYSVLRVCADYPQFLKYGGTRSGVVGWFSPNSKELVVFIGGDKMLRQPGFTAGVTYHEGWHQYADFYFDHPDTPDKTSLHRWFDEGWAEYFGGHRLYGGKYKYFGCKSRYAINRKMAETSAFLPFKKIVRMSIGEFYDSKRSSKTYAQAQSLVAYLLLGQKTKDWDPKWDGILEMYRRAMLVKGKNSIATETAFLNWTDEDYAKLEVAWKNWVDSSKFPKGR